MNIQKNLSGDKRKVVVFGSYKQIDNILNYYPTDDVITIELAPRKITRRLNQSIFYEMLAIPPYVISASSMLVRKEDLLFTLGYFTSLATADFDILNEVFSNKIIISAENNNEYGPRMIIAFLLNRLGYETYYFDVSNISNLKDTNIYYSNLAFNDCYNTWTEECIDNVVARLAVIFPQVNINSSLDDILECTGLMKFRNDNIKFINLVNSGHYYPNLFGESVENEDLLLLELQRRIMLTRQSISSQFTKTVIELSTDIINKFYQSQSMSKDNFN